MSNFLAHAFDSARKHTQDAARLALPQRCELCAGASGNALVCATCDRALPRITHPCPVCALPSAAPVPCGPCLADPPPFDATLAAYAYAFPVDRMVQSFKYHGRLALADWCAEAILAARARMDEPLPDAIVALPLAAARQRERGFNQSVEIARLIASNLRVAQIDAGVRRIRASRPQADLPWTERAANVRGAFVCDVSLSALRVAVIDDVMTTGATLSEFARTLKRAGAARVENWVVARTPPPG
ncbi:MAG: ComF family protein [Betaproteobacteria bacterium]